MGVSSRWPLGVGDNALLRGTVGVGALSRTLYVKCVSLLVVLDAAFNSPSLRCHPGSNSACWVEASGAAGDVGDEVAVQILSRLLAIDKGEAMSGVGAEEEIGSHPD